MNAQQTIYTIGYAPHNLEEFTALLILHQIEVIADVRSTPYSQYKSEFNRERLVEHLKKSSIGYVFFGDLWGARIEDPDCYINGQVDFELAAQRKDFRAGIERVKMGMQRYRIALMCAEKDPLTCHRGILISRNVCTEGINIQHILADGSLEKHSESELRLLTLHKLQHPNMFENEQQRIARAYTLQAGKVAFSDHTMKETPEDNLLL
jgi:uncharacterized protein (DUF488 family)